jgi:hypothetical protein
VRAHRFYVARSEPVRARFFLVFVALDGEAGTWRRQTFGINVVIMCSM